VIWAQTHEKVGSVIADRRFLLSSTVYVHGGTDRKMERFQMLWPHRDEVVSGGTILTGEENINNYFRGKAADPSAGKLLQRYGIAGRGRYMSWGLYQDRFDLAKEPNEPNRFGWVVEIDPYDPSSTPVKRTALGRYAHEGATVILAKDGRPVAYMGDDARFEYLYKFVAKNRSLTLRSRLCTRACPHRPTKQNPLRAGFTLRFSSPNGFISLRPGESLPFSSSPCRKLKKPFSITEVQNPHLPQFQPLTNPTARIRTIAVV
jgi:hypothetical protein